MTYIMFLFYVYFIYYIIFHFNFNNQNKMLVLYYNGIITEDSEINSSLLFQTMWQQENID